MVCLGRLQRCDDKLAEMAEHRHRKSANRSTVGIMNEFARMGDVYPESVQHPHRRRVGTIFGWLRPPTFRSTPERSTFDRELPALVANWTG